MSQKYLHYQNILFIFAHEMFNLICICIPRNKNILIMNTSVIKETIAKRLQDFRKMRGMSQAALAEKIETITKSSIEKFEKAEMMPSPQTLSSMAEALGVMTDDLIRPYVVNVDYDKVRYRKRSKMPKKEVERLQRLYGNKLERYIEVERLLGAEVSFTLNYEDIPVRKYEDAQYVARRFREDMGWGVAPVISPIQQLEAKGVKVFVLDEEESCNKDFDGMCYKEQGLAVVILKKCENTEHDRFTLFHEMGHLLMNTIDQDGNELEGKELETLCNAFASEVLFPEMEFRLQFGATHKIYPDHLKLLQRDWGISCSAQMYKAKDLGMITQNRYIGYCVRLNRNKPLKAYMEKSVFEAEHTSRYQQLVWRAVKELKITRSKAAALLNMPLSEMNETLDGKEAECIALS